MDVQLLREDQADPPRARYLVQVVRSGRCGTVGTFDEADNPGAERLAQACAIRVASALHCRITRG